MNMKKDKWLTREKIREKTTDINLIDDVFKTIHHLIPDFRYYLLNVSDPRHKSYTTYKTDILLFTRIFSAICNIESMNTMSRKFNNSNVIHNINSFTNSDYSDLPHYTTINNFLKKLSPDDLEFVKLKMINTLIRNKCFYQFRLLNKFWKVIIDASCIYTFKERHCEHCLTKTYNKGTENEYTIYFHYVLEAKLVVSNMVFSIASEFIENLSGEFDKQDCELKAFSRLAPKLKSFFPKLPICILADSLYACESFFEICKNNKWQFIIRFKDGSIKSLSEDFNGLLKHSVAHYLNDKEYCKFENSLPYKDFSLNLSYFLSTSSDFPFRLYFFFSFYSF